MTAERFEQILREAVSGNHLELEVLLKMYMPMIKKHSYLNGMLDEDLQQYIMMRIALNLSKFPF